MNGRRALTLGIVVVGAGLAFTAMALKWRENRAFFDPAVLLSRFPVEDAAVVNIDFAALRRAGLAAGPKAPVENEYTQFLQGTGFDYRRDLDLLTASFSQSGNFFIARGRFDWKKLREYAARQGGSCYDDLCRVQGSRPERHISFLPLRDDTMALAVSGDDLAASRLTKPGARVTAALPAAPVWISVPGVLLRQPGALSPGLHVMLSAMTNADRVVVTVGPAGQKLQARLEAFCRSEDEARVLASQLRSLTGLLKEGLGRVKQAPPDELALMLVGGTFEQAGSRVNGRWPVDRGLLEALTSGI